ncbi:hypothetical protein AAUPMB_00030 [Pasteurella multocida subsp. multocida str. Anand1_buffalo]|nr:hypothetical protein AAUPMB_00030 [Pasteurella multocida subsp. multocida str. Anand1_buffalo]
MRLDKFLAENTGLTRSQANKVLKAKCGHGKWTR